ncbi:MAG: hypothetical protein KDA62_17355 [Planctomycetales bacterium]|nr:hypothetical protein [Planctomycetales bacterium]
MDYWRLAKLGWDGAVLGYTNHTIEGRVFMWAFKNTSVGQWWQERVTASETRMNERWTELKALGVTASKVPELLWRMQVMQHQLLDALEREDPSTFMAAAVMRGMMIQFQGPLGVLAAAAARGEPPIDLDQFFDALMPVMEHLLVMFLDQVTPRNLGFIAGMIAYEILEGVAITAVTAGAAAAPVVMVKVPKVLAKLKTVSFIADNAQLLSRLNKAMDVVNGKYDNLVEMLEKLRKVVEIPKGKIGTVPRVDPSTGKFQLADTLLGTTEQANRIGRAIKKGDIGTNLLGDELFAKAYRLYGGQGVADDVVAFAVGNQMYLRRGSESLASDAVHEGTHALDWLRGFPDVTDADILSLEKRAFFFERQFQRATTGTSEFSTIEEMLKFIFENYP